MKTIFIPFLCLLAICSYSQSTEVLSIDKKFKQGTLPKSYAVFPFVDTVSGELHLTLVDNKSVDRYIIDSNWKVKNSFSSSRDVYTNGPAYKRFDDLRMFCSNGQEYNIYMDKRNWDINTISYTDKNETTVATLPINSKADILSYFITAGSLCIVEADKKTSLLHIITNIKKGGFSFDTIDVKLAVAEKTSAAKEMDKHSLIKLGMHEIERLMTKNKIYFKGTTIFITNDREEATYCTEVNLANDSITYKKFPQVGFKKAVFKTQTLVEAECQYSSFLNGNLLINGIIYYTDDKLSVSFYNYTTGALAHTYSVNATDDSISFKNGPLLNKKPKEIKNIKDILNDDDYKNGRYFNIKSREIKIKRFLHEAERGLVFDASDIGNNQTELIVKTYMYGVNASSSMGPGGMTTIAGKPFLENGSYFKGIFTKDTYEHISGETDTTSTLSLIEKKMDDIGDGDAVTFFAKEGFIYIGYYDADKKQYVIERITKIIE